MKRGAKNSCMCKRERVSCLSCKCVCVCVYDIFSLFPPWEGVLLEHYSCVFRKQAPVLPAKTSTAHTCTHRDTNCSPKKTTDQIWHQNHKCFTIFYFVFTSLFYLRICSNSWSVHFGSSSVAFKCDLLIHFHLTAWPL